MSLRSPGSCSNSCSPPSRNKGNRSSSKSPKRRPRRSRSSSRTRSSNSSFGQSRSNSKTGTSSRLHKDRSRSSSRSDPISDSKNSLSSKNRTASKSNTPPRYKLHSSKPYESEIMKNVDPLKQKILKATKAAAVADAELREKGLLKDIPMPLPDVNPILNHSLSEQLQRGQALDEINAPSFVQHRFSSSRTQPTKITKITDDVVHRDTHMAAIFGLSAPKLGSNPISLDASIKKLETWKENPEMLIHESLLVDQVGKQERWLKKLILMRKKKHNE